MLPDADVVAACDLSEERLARASAALSISPTHRYTSIESMLEREELDIAVVATRTNLHSELALPPLEAGLHVIGEKPMDDDLDGAHAMMATADRNGVQLAIHHQGRIMPCEREMQRRIAAGDIGRVVEVRAGAKGYYGGYDLMNQGTHLLSSFRGLVDSEFAWVHATLETGDRPTQPEDIVEGPNHFGVIAGEHLVVELRFENGARGILLEQRHDPVHKDNTFIHVRGTEGQLWVAYDTSRYFITRDTRLGPEPVWEEVRVPYERYVLDGVRPDHPALRRGEIYFAREMIDALEQGREHTCSGREAVKIMELIMGAYIAHFEGRRVHLPLQERGHPLVRVRAEAGLPPVDPDVPVSYGEWERRELARIEQVGMKPYGLRGPA